MDKFTDKYNTKLSPTEEKKFNQWVTKTKRFKDTEDYDLRGAWKELNSGDMEQANNGHLGDKYKKPNHPTFSDESIYHGVDNNYGGKWLETPSGMTFEVGPSQEKMWSPKDLQKYFQKVEPNVKLSYPKMLSPELLPVDENQDLYSRVNKAIEAGGAMYRDNF